MDENFNLKGLITIKDIEKSVKYPNTARDKEGRLLCAAAIGVTNDVLDRAKALADAEKFLLEYAPVVPVIFNESFAFVNDDISKLTWDYFGNPVFVDVKQKNYEKYLKTEE